MNIVNKGRDREEARQRMAKTQGRSDDMFIKRHQQPWLRSELTLLQSCSAEK